MQLTSAYCDAVFATLSFDMAKIKSALSKFYRQHYLEKMKRIKNVFCFSFLSERQHYYEKYRTFTQY